jgi:hypothetical protein
LAFDRLAADDPASLELLSLIAWCGPEPLPLSLLTGEPDVLPERLRWAVADPLAFNRCVRMLRRRGMITSSANAVQMHRVPQVLLLARTAEAARDWSELVVRLLHAAAPLGRVGKPRRLVPMAGRTAPRAGRCRRRPPD